MFEWHSFGNVFFSSTEFVIIRGRVPKNGGNRGSGMRKQKKNEENTCFPRNPFDSAKAAYNISSIFVSIYSFTIGDNQIVL